jgi:hypothetical protein
LRRLQIGEYRETVIAQEHLYVIEKKNDRVTIFFLTNRMGYLITILLIFGFCFAVIKHKVSNTPLIPYDAWERNRLVTLP